MDSKAIESINAKLDRINTIVCKLSSDIVEIQTTIKDGPGTWYICKQHEEINADHEKRIRTVERRVFMAVGALCFINFCGVVIGIVSYLKH